MASRDHSLDDKIVEAATAEFLEFGFQKASLRRIAQRANLSTGALYTRYESKDALFCSIVEGILARIGKELGPVTQVYADAQVSGSVDSIMEAIRQEEKITQKILFDHYDQCVLLCCRSDGSSLGEKLEQMLAFKAKGTVAFLEGIAGRKVNEDAVAVILSEQFYCYRAILLKGLSREKTAECLDAAAAFHEAGWRELFHQIMK